MCGCVLCFEEIPLHNFSSKHPKSSQQYHKTWVHKEFPKSITVAFSTFRSLFLFVNRDSSVKWGGSELEMMLNLWMLMDKIAKGATRVKALANGYKCKTLSRQLDVLNERTSECVCVCVCLALLVRMIVHLNVYPNDIFCVEVDFRSLRYACDMRIAEKRLRECVCACIVMMW